MTAARALVRLMMILRIKNEKEQKKSKKWGVN